MKRVRYYVPNRDLDSFCVGEKDDFDDVELDESEDEEFEEEMLYDGD
jgi:hypothetical protein